MNTTPLAAGALGAGLMYFLDPDRGRRRRRYVRDKSMHMGATARKALGVATRDLRNRTKGTVAGLRSSFTYDAATDQQLEARIRTRLGRTASRPRLISVSVVDGVATVDGAVLKTEAAEVRRAIASTSGVQSVVDRLEPCDDFGRLSTMPEEPRHARPGLKWTPAARLLAGIAGSALATHGLRRRGLLGATTGAIGLGVIMLSTRASGRNGG